MYTVVIGEYYSFGDEFGCPEHEYSFNSRSECNYFIEELHNNNNVRDLAHSKGKLDARIDYINSDGEEVTGKTVIIRE